MDMSSVIEYLPVDESFTKQQFSSMVREANAGYSGSSVSWLLFLLHNHEQVDRIKGGLKRMTEKKHAINISLVMIVLCLVIMLLCWPKKDDGIAEFFFILSTGVFGSSFATLWIFIYEYRKAKHELLSTIFREVTSIFENEPLPLLYRIGFYDLQVAVYMERKYYIPPVHMDVVEQMNRSEKCLYELCRFVDGILDVGYDKISHICSLVEEIDFWSDTFRRRSKYRDAMVHNISLPLYEVFISAPAMEDGYIFRYFKGFRMNYDYSADEVYPFVCELDQAIHGLDGEIKYEWQKRNQNLVLHMHETMWIFRDAFFSPGLSCGMRYKAIQAFLRHKPYPYVR